jgi:nucleoside-diphosphate-sugar epimerase
MDLKRVLITGKNSYVGTNVEKWLMKEPDKYYVESISVRGDEWKSFDFSKFDVVLHVAGIAHIKERKKNSELYFIINRDLTFEIAKISKINDIKQFIFLSSMSVYGIDRGVINKDTIENPKTAYGKSKFEAEKKILNLENSSFKVAILRPPMIYGKMCKGNYSKLAKFAKKTPFFLGVNNKRSMIYMDNLSELIKQLIINRNFGVFLPQNNEYVSTSTLVNLIATIHGNKITIINLFNPILKLFKFSNFNKIFGDLYYDKNSSEIPLNYALIDFETSILESEL